jgi:hypothetical protein
MSMFPKFDAVPVHGLFLVGSETMQKASDFTFYAVYMKEMGERSIDPFSEDRIVYPITAADLDNTFGVDVGAKVLKNDTINFNTRIVKSEEV